VLVDQKKLATDAGARHGIDAELRGIAGKAVIRRAGVTLEQLEKAIDQVLGGTMVNAPQAADLNRAKTGLVASVTYRRDNQFSMASAYGQALAIGLTVDDVNEWPARIRAVTAADVQGAAKRLNRRDAVTAYLVPGGGK
jgi:zinc protease